MTNQIKMPYEMINDSPELSDDSDNDDDDDDDLLQRLNALRSSDDIVNQTTESTQNTSMIIIPIQDEQLTYEENELLTHLLALPTTSSSTTNSSLSSSSVQERVDHARGGLAAIARALDEEKNRRYNEFFNKEMLDNEIARRLAVYESTLTNDFVKKEIKTMRASSSLQRKYITVKDISSYKEVLLKEKRNSIKNMVNLEQESKHYEKYGKEYEQMLNINRAPLTFDLDGVAEMFNL